MDIGKLLLFGKLTNVNNFISRLTTWTNILTTIC